MNRNTMAGPWSWLHFTWMPVVLVGLVSCGGPANKTQGPKPDNQTPKVKTKPEPAETARPAPKTVSFKEDKVFKSADGMSFEVPARWFFTRHEKYMELQAPSKELWIALMKVPASKCEEAISKAWKSVRKGFDLKKDRTVKPPTTSSGWDAVVQTTYVTLTKERRAVLAVAFRKEKRFYVALVDGKIQALSRRGAQMNTVLSSLRAPGVEKETFKGKKAHALKGERLKKFEAFAKKTKKKANVLGAAVGLVQDGKVIYTKGFGLRKKGGRRPVTPRTLFMIGSMTKALTTMMMAKMVDEGKFKWSTPAKKVYPGFGLGDAASADKCTMKHTVCACTGMPRQDMEFLFQFKGETAESRMKLLKTMKPTTGFGETFQYSNLMVAAGGYMAGHSAYPKKSLRAAYRKAMATRLFKPAKMKRTIFRMEKVRRLNHAKPHSMNNKYELVPIPMSYEDTVVSVGPAGGAWSNIMDMANYLRLEMTKGKSVTGKRVVSAANVTERWEPQARVSEETYYGLALMVSKSKGVTQIGHGGATLGFSSYMFFLPEQDVGMVVLTNRQGGGVFTGVLKRRLMEILFDGKPKAGKNLDFVLAERKKQLADFEKRAERKLEKKWIRPYLGVYTNKALGKVTLSFKGGRVRFDAGEWNSPVLKYTGKDGTVKLMIGPPLAGLPFTMGEEGGKKTLTLTTGQQKYVFTHK